MLKKRIKYTDYNGNVREEDFYFNFTKAEVMEWEMGIDGGMSAMLDRIVQLQDIKKIKDTFKEIILKSYGEKSLDGRTFIKSEELSKNFMSTEAYSELVMELLLDPNKAADFINAIVPKVDGQNVIAPVPSNNFNPPISN